MTHRWGDGFRVIHKRNVYIKPVNIYGKKSNKNGFFHPHHGINWTTNIDIFGRNGPARKGDASVRSENIDAWLLNANLSVANLHVPFGNALQRIWGVIFGYFNFGQKIGAGIEKITPDKDIIEIYTGIGKKLNSFGNSKKKVLNTNDTIFVKKDSLPYKTGPSYFDVSYANKGDTLIQYSEGVFYQPNK